MLLGSPRRILRQEPGSRSRRFVPLRYRLPHRHPVNNDLIPEARAKPRRWGVVDLASCIDASRLANCRTVAVALITGPDDAAARFGAVGLLVSGRPVCTLRDGELVSVYIVI